MKRRLRRERIHKKLKDISDAVKLVADHLPEDFDAFSQLGLVKDGIYKKIEFAIECMLDVLAILNADLALGVPGNEEDIIGHVEQKNIIDSNSAEKVREMRGFRNILVHRYSDINDRLAFHALKEHLNDFDEFIRIIERFLATVKTEKSP
ncbi:MAG: DUF86 domain-containing protein [Candidatus Heimdallarchaeota archaeon]